jgi:hypothetical protein
VTKVVQQWTGQEFAGLDLLGDARLNKRAKRMMERFFGQSDGQHPGCVQQLERDLRSLPLLGNAEVEWEAVIAPHWARTKERMRAQPVVLCIQDSTELDFNGQEIDGLGRSITKRGAVCTCTRLTL